MTNRIINYVQPAFTLKKLFNNTGILGSTRCVLHGYYSCLQLVTVLRNAILSSKAVKGVPKLNDLIYTDETQGDICHGKHEI
jgi:hypothetical protein